MTRLREVTDGNTSTSQRTTTAAAAPATDTVTNYQTVRDNEVGVVPTGRALIGIVFTDQQIEQLVAGKLIAVDVGYGSMYHFIRRGAEENVERRFRLPNDGPSHM